MEDYGDNSKDDYSWVWWIVVVGVIVYFAFFNNANNTGVELPVSFGESFSESQHSTIDEEDVYESSNSEEVQVSDSLDFNGYECTDDCSGHEAGYEWAEENGITQDDVDNYSGNSNSFMEGMQSYVDENE